MIARFLGALQFLTIWPARSRTASLGQSAIFFPLTGALLGASAGGVLLVCNRVVSKQIAALIAIAWLMTATGCLHEDGLADVADAFRAGRSREKIMAILKDSRIGTYGAIALITAIALRWQALADCRINAVYALTATLALSRSSLAVLGGTTIPAGEGLGRAFQSGLSRGILFATATQAVAITFIVDWHYAVPMLLATSITILLARRWFLRRLGGITGDCLGATCQAVEILNLVILACRRYS